MALVHSIFNSLILSQLVLLVSAHYVKCPDYVDCGHLGQITFPFTTTQHPHCGILAIHGCDDHQRVNKSIHLILNNTTTRWFNVITVEDGSLVIIDEVQRQYLRTRNCEAFNHNSTLPQSTPLASFGLKYNITLYRCNHSHTVSLPHLFRNFSKCGDYNIYYGPLNNEMSPGSKQPTSLAPCSRVVVAVKDESDSDDPFTFVAPEIFIDVRLSDECNKCFHKRGQCQLDNQGKFYCAKGSRTWVLKMGLVLGLAVAVTMLLVLAVLCYTRWKKQNPTQLLIKAFFERHDAIQTKCYTYSEIKKMTNNFRNKLGQGGFGTVYKGKLPDGRSLAVKVLNEMKGNGEEFINEVATISRTSHVNIVTLLGFCFQGSKRALVFEFMPNGSLEKFIFEENALSNDRLLDCQTLYHIAIGVARGLEYLHKGCNARILHFDIKPHNILLDENFCPKISDFGLAKICTRKESMVSIFGARGTAGYIAAEVFSRNFGSVSHKSDVYSYGMMVLEMVGRRKNIKAEGDHSSQIYFPHWIYNRLESNQELGLRSIRNESDEEMVRKMTIVSLWCIQTKPSTRPAISEVVEMLKGRVGLLRMPPKPFLFSPPASPLHCSTRTCETIENPLL